MPKPGDLSLCIGCGVILEFDHRLHVNVAPADATDRLDADSRRALELARKFIRSRAMKRAH